MSPSWLANTDPAHAWAHHAWPEFPALSARAGACAILPLFPFIAAEDRPADECELIASELLRLASLQLGPEHPHLILPPLRFLPAAGPAALFSVDYSTAHELALSLARHIAAAGFGKLVLFSPDQQSTPFAATIAIDARAELDLASYVLTLPRPGQFPDPADTTAMEGDSAILANLLLEMSLHRSPTGVTSWDLLPLPAKRPPPPLHPAFRSRSLCSLEPEALRRAALVPGAVAIIPTASIEQHGHHLPVGVDAILGQAQLEAALRETPQDSPVWIAPPLSYGKSNEHKGFPGTVSISAPILYALACACIRELSRLGFKRILFFNTHGGNTAVLSSLISAAPREGPSLGFLRASFRPQLCSAQETAWGMHADEWETSLMLACAPELVAPERAVCEYPALLTEPGLLRPEKSPATFAWLTRDLSKSGVMGDPTAATREKGLQWLKAEGVSLAQSIAVYLPPKAPCPHV